MSHLRFWLVTRHVVVPSGLYHRGMPLRRTGLAGNLCVQLSVMSQRYEPIALGPRLQLARPRQ